MEETWSNKFKDLARLAILWTVILQKWRVWNSFQEGHFWITFLPCLMKCIPLQSSTCEYLIRARITSSALLFNNQHGSFQLFYQLLGNNISLYFKGWLSCGITDPYLQYISSWSLSINAVEDFLWYK